MFSERKLIQLLWTVILSLLIGGGIAGYMIIHKADELQQANQELGSANDALRHQLDDAASPSPSPSPSPTASPTGSPSPSVAPPGGSPAP
jgi:outer membrane murein-binding lipoprotein Lpp